MINSPPDPDQLPMVPVPAPSSAELELLRQQTIRTLGSVAAVLESAAAQRQKLLAEVQTAEHALLALASERATAGARLAATRALLDDAATQLELAQVQRSGVLSEVEYLHNAGLESRVALHDEVAALERRREALARAVAPADELGAAPSIAALASRLKLRRAGRQGIKRLVGSIHVGFSQIATGALIALLLGLAFLLTPLTQVFGGLQLLAVMSGSMEPTIPVGGIVAIRPVAATDLKVGDAITFVNLSNPDVLVTHRIVSLELRDGQTMLTTKGDANDSVDALSAPATRAVGRVEFALPYLGYLMVWLGTPLAKIGIVALAVLGLVLTSVQRSNTPSKPSAAPGAEDTYLDHERNIQSLLGQ